MERPDGCASDFVSAEAGVCGMRVTSAQPAIVVANGFSFAYPAGDAVLAGIDWEVDAGSFVLLVGATGSGKSTLLRCLKPELVPVGERRGSLRVLDRPIEDFAPSESAPLIGYVAQDPSAQIVCDAVWHEIAFGLENIGLDRGVMRRRVAETVGFLGIEHLMHAAPTDLSGGQQQLVNLAGVLAMQPRLLLLDEPTAQLDPIAEKNFLHALFRINRELGITVIVATHSPEAMVDYATDAVRITRGTLEPCALASLEARGTGFSGVRAAEAGGTTSSRADAFSVRDGYFRYARDMPWVLRGCDVRADEGGIHAIVGGNGSGKTTLLRLIAGAIKPERGRVSNALSKRQALLPQDPKALFVCDSVEDELLEWAGRGGYGPSEVAAALERFDLSAVAKRHPFDTSGGQQQKLALAKVLLTKPQLLLLDEPTKGLDATSRCEIAAILSAQRNAGCTVVIASHDLSFVSQVADTVSMLFDGQTACTEPTNAFFEGNIFYRPVCDGFMKRWLETRDIEAEAAAGGSAVYPFSGSGAG